MPGTIARLQPAPLEVTVWRLGVEPGLDWVNLLLWEKCAGVQDAPGDPIQVWWVVTLPPCRVERATLLGVVAVQCSMPLLQGLPVQISLLISPVRMMAVKVSNQDCRMRKDWWQICVVPVFRWWFVDVVNVISAHANDIGHDNTHAASETSLNYCSLITGHNGLRSRCRHQLNWQTGCWCQRVT